MPGFEQGTCLIATFFGRLSCPCTSEDGIPRDVFSPWTFWTSFNMIMCRTSTYAASLSCPAHRFSFANIRLPVEIADRSTSGMRCDPRTWDQEDAGAVHKKATLTLLPVYGPDCMASLSATAAPFVFQRAKVIQWVLLALYCDFWVCTTYT
jgi:hypothetical protein